MTNEFRVIDLRSDVIEPEPLIVQGARSPELAAQSVLGEELVRSGAKKDLVARVYWTSPGQPTSMVRLYSKVGRGERQAASQAHW